MKSIMDDNIKTVFHWIDLSLDDLKKLINANYPSGSSPNFPIAQISLSITEPVAKLSHPFRLGRGGALEVPSIFDRVNAKLASQYFFEKYFTNTRYSELAWFIWDCFRNGHVHLFSPKKIINVPMVEIDNSFLTGVHISGSTIEKLENDPSQMNLERSEHLQFSLKYNNSGVPRPIFRFSPVIYYFDLKEAVENYARDLRIDTEAQRRFQLGYPLYEAAQRLAFDSRKIRDSERSILTDEIEGILEA